MDDLDEMARRHDAMLDELARMGMELVGVLEARFERCDTLAELERLVREYDRAARDVRQTLALKAHLKRQHVAARRAAERRALRRPQTPPLLRTRLH